MDFDTELAKTLGSMGVANIHLNVQLAQVSAQLATAQTQLVQANADREALGKRLEEVQGELEALKSPPAQAPVGQPHPLDTNPPPVVEGAA